ncbi:MAG: rRNA adenine N-6-methyltransferase family protein [Paracoccaceae bacterium]
MSLFLKQFACNPSDVGAIAPSGPALAKCMARDLGQNSENVVEIGAGTGAVSQGILNAGVAQHNLTMIELNPQFCTALAAKFPKTRVLNCMAQDMQAHGVVKASTVISSLPLLNIPGEIQKAILQTVFTILPADGKMVQFTYGPRAPISDELCQDLNLTVERRGKTWLNLPPATVYVYRQRP